MSAPFPKSDHFDGKHFFTPGAPRMAGLREVAKWRFGKRDKTSPPRAAWPKWVEITPRALPPRPAPGSRDIVATWINHSTFLLQTASANILFDPVFSRCCGPFGKIGALRAHAPGIALDALPPIDIVCLSHDHYDHCDIPTLRQLAQRGRATQHPPLGITPLGNAPLLRRAGFAPARIVELDWWQTCEFDCASTAACVLECGTPVPLSVARVSQSKAAQECRTPRQACQPAQQIHITLTPAQHWSNRLTGLRNRRLWGGFFIKIPSAHPAPPAPPISPISPITPIPPISPILPASATSAAPARTIYFAGDTGYHATLFRDIAARLGPPDLAMLPIGAYEPRWFMSPQHCNPAEAVRIHCDLAARQSVAMHWGTFQLTDEPRDAPPRALAQALRDASLPPHVFKVLEPGESLTI